jgi:transcriptional regulator with XRE-family HTH domain
LKKPHSVAEPQPELDEASTPHALLGGRLRHARRMAGLTLLQLAQKAHCSESLISKIEKGNATPSLATLHRLAVALDTNIAALTSATEPTGGPVMRQGERLERVVLPNRNGLLQANIHILDPGQGSDGQIEHIGEEVGYVLEGTVELTLRSASYILHAGDAFTFTSETPHGYRNAGDTMAKILWVNTPATY